MAKSKRMINSNLVNASSFKMKTSNKAKLLYFYIMMNADDKGFCDNADELIALLNHNDAEYGDNPEGGKGFEEAIEELLNKNLLLVFENKYKDKVYLVRHWYLHNQIPKDRVTETTYVKYLSQVTVNKEGEYVKKEAAELLEANEGRIEMPTVWDDDAIKKALEIKVRSLRGESVGDDELRYLAAYDLYLQASNENGENEKGVIQVDPDDNPF